MSTYTEQPDAVSATSSGTPRSTLLKSLRDSLLGLARGPGAGSSAAPSRHDGAARPRDPVPSVGPVLRRVAGTAGKWKIQLSQAKTTWAMVSVDELIATDGHVQKLAGLVQERYGLSHEDAEIQVRRFFEQHAC